LWEVLYDLTYGSVNVRFTYVTFCRRGSLIGNKVSDALASGAANELDNYTWDYKKDLKAWINNDPKVRHNTVKSKKERTKPKINNEAEKAFMPF
jgi:hypothetical protein